MTAATERATPSGIVIRLAFRDGTVEEVFGEKNREGSMLSPYPNAVCAYRFLRRSTNRFLPWIPIFSHDLGDVRTALSYKLEMLTGGRALPPETSSTPLPGI
jgi:hypothetical protein